MRKFTIILGLSALIAAPGAVLAHDDGDSKRVVKRDIFVQKVRILDEADTDGDGQVSRQEYLADPGRDFDELDKNGDGFIDREERGGSALIIRRSVDWDNAIVAPMIRLEGTFDGRFFEELDEQLADLDARIEKALKRAERSRQRMEREFDLRDFELRIPSFDHGSFAFRWRNDGLMEHWDKNEDGQITREEFSEKRDRLFDRLDDNEDGVLDEDELDDFGLDGFFAFEELHSEEEE